MKYYKIFLIIIILSSCDDKSSKCEVSDSKLFWEFKHVIEVVDNEEEITLQMGDKIKKQKLIP